MEIDPPVPQKKTSEGFLPYMVMVDILVVWSGQFEQLLFPYPKKASQKIWVQFASFFLFFRKTSYNFDIWVKQWPWPLGHHLKKKLWWTHVPYATYLVSRQLALWFLRWRFLKGFYHIWSWWPSWTCDLDHLNKLSSPHPMEAPHEIWFQSAWWFQRRRCLKMMADRWRQQSLFILQAHQWSKDSGELKMEKDWYKTISLQAVCLIFILHLGMFIYIQYIFQVI